MTYSVFNQTPNDATKEPMFLGNGVNVSRFDKQRYEVFEKLTEKQISFFWRPEEIDLSKDRIDFESLTEHEKHIFINNLKYQTLLDSVQGRSPTTVLLPLVSIPELEVWISTWAFFECVAEGTEVLTTEGWKDISKVTTEDNVLVYNLDNETVFFEKPKRTTDYDFDNEMVEYYSSVNGQFHQLVTPNHRMPVKTRVKQGSTSSKFFKEADFQDYKPNHLAPISGRLHSKNKNRLSALDRLKIAVQADGTVSDRYTGERVGTVPVWLSLTKQRKIDRLISLAKQAEIDLIELTPEPTGQRRFKLVVPVEHKPLEWKRLDSWVKLEEVSYDWCLDFLEEISLWDSHIYNHKNGDSSFEYSSIVKSNADVIQAVATLCNHTARYKLRQDNRKTSYSDLNYLNVLPKSFKDGQSINKRKVPYKGKVYCLETSTGAFVIRYKNTVSVTGNTIHSRSYTHIMRNVFVNPSEVLDDIMINPAIINRAKELTQYYDDLYAYSISSNPNPYELKKKLYLCLMAVNVLEAMRFYVSFACSFAFAERKLMEGNAKIIRLISRDEAIHLNSTQTMLRLLPKEDEDFAKIEQECESLCINMFWQAVESEKEWIKYLFKDGSMIGLNEKILTQYLEYLANIRMQAVGLTTLYSQSSNPIGWINSWLSSDNVQVAPQETEITAYLVGQVDANLNPDDFSDFEI